jgi:hypothetical protein
MAQSCTTEDLGQGYTIDTLQNASGHIYYRICTRGTCRYAEDYWMVLMYAESMGWLPPNKQPTA